MSFIRNLFNVDAELCSGIGARGKGHRGTSFEIQTKGYQHLGEKEANKISG